MSQTIQTGDGVGRLINLVPVGLKEAAIDSPTSRASVVHYGEQLEHLERWLDDYMKATNRLVTESVTLENILTNFTSHAMVPTTVAESMLDHDYDVLAMKRYSESAKDFWMSMVSVVKRLPALVAEPIRVFIQNDLRAFKEARRMVELYQKNFDSVHAKYSALGKSKEPSSLREEAFQLHEARKAYLKAHLDFFAIAPQFRFALDKLLVKIFFDQWREMRISRDNTAATFQRSANDMERVKSWISEMESSERLFRRELQTARRQLEETAETSARPSRELDDYSSLAAQLGGHGHASSTVAVQKSPKKPGPIPGEKQGWLYLRTFSGRPTRTVWVKRWAFLRNGVIGWLLQNARGAGVEESERIGVLLCNVRPAVTEERRFCFELKTNRHTIVLQAETQSELFEWTAAIQAAKSKALEDPGASDTLGNSTQPHSDPAFSISAPPVPPFGSLILNSTEPGASADDGVGGLDRSSTLPVPNDHPREHSGSVDLARRSTAYVEETGQREHSSRERLMSKLDLHRKAPPSPSLSPSPSTPIGGGGVASLIAASHGSMPVGPSIPFVQNVHDPEKSRTTFTLALRDMPSSTLAPSTLANVPAPTNMSKPAVVVSGERGVSGSLDKSGIPNSLLANMWGSSNAAVVNRLDKSDQKMTSDTRLETQPSPLMLPSNSPPKSPTRSPLRIEAASTATLPQLDLAPSSSLEKSRSTSPTKRHRKTISSDNSAAQAIRSDLVAPEFPNYYPLQLKTQDAQFRLLFPTARRDERLVLVFRATWNPNDQQDFPGRIYVTANNMYFYSNHLGLVLTSGVTLASIDEATAAPGRECDFVFLHMKDGVIDGTPTRITVKVFVEPLKLLQRRINYLIRNCTSSEPASLEEVIKTLLKLESEAPNRSPSLESWEDVSPDTPVDVYGQKRRGRSSTMQSDSRAPTRIDRSFALNTTTTQLDKTAKFKLPAQPVKYTPPGNLELAVEREYDVSPKALFHVMFGDKSALWQLLQHERRASNLKQGPWLHLGEGRMRRDFEFEIPYNAFFGFGADQTIEVRDYQVVDVNSDHLCYVVTDKRTPWHLPLLTSHRLVSKIVITHVAKGKCKLAIFTRVEWIRMPWRNVLKGMVERQALIDLESDALDLVDLVGDQVRKLGAHSRTKKAVTIFGQVGQSTEVTQTQIDAAAHAIEIRKVPVRRTLTGLVAQDAASAAQSAFGLALEAIVDTLGWLGKTISTNKLILVLLVISALYNSYHTSKASWSWYSEWRAARFMNTLGVTPGTVMSKAVYVADLDDAMTTSGHLPDREQSSCYSVFYDEHRLVDLDTPLISVGTGSERETDQLHAARRVQKTRKRLGKYRHDLLVGLRVVDRVEREVVKSEWERWVREEAGMCNVVENIGVLDGGNVTAVVGRGYEDYCRSCEDEVGRLSTN
jgi:VAD1 Analog of StAR-related lipid transfer domain/BAR domain of APPL family/PH domain